MGILEKAEAAPAAGDDANRLFPAAFNDGEALVWWRAAEESERMGNRVAEQVHPARRDVVARSEAEDEEEATRREVLASSGRSCWKAIARPCSYIKRIESERRANERRKQSQEAPGNFADLKRSSPRRSG